MKKLSLLLIGMITLFSACETKDTVKMTVASEKRMAMGAAPMEVLLVKEGDAQEWSFFYSNIEGFNFEPGYEYVLEVKKENIEQPTPADASSIKYTLVKEVSKTQKTSENMLEGLKEKSLVWTAKVLEIEGSDVGVGGAAGKFPVQVVKLHVTALNGEGLPFAEGDTIHAELKAEPSVVVERDVEYVFDAKDAHPAHALGVYMLETDVKDLTK